MSSWNTDWFPLGQAVFDREHQQVAAVSRAPGNLDLFVVGNDNHVWTMFWNDHEGWHSDWFPLGQAVFDREHQQVAAVSRAPGNLDLFVVGNDNHVWTLYWNDHEGWHSDWFPLPGLAVFDRDHQEIAAVSRAEDDLDLFVVGNDSHVWTTFWNPSGSSVTPLIQNGPLGAKITIAVVGDGFTVADQDAYNQAVDNLLTNGVFAHDFFAANRAAFNVMRVNSPSVDSGVSTKTYDASGNVVAQTNRNTVLGTIFNGDWAHCWSEYGPDTSARLAHLLNVWVPEHRLIILVQNNPGFGGCARGDTMTLALGVGWTVFGHELGHAFGGVGDEYHQRNDAYTGSDAELPPNLTSNTDRATLKWGWAVGASTAIPTDGHVPAGWNDNQDVGLFQGGGGSFATGLYRPVLSCRMNTNDPPYCPVCNRAMTDHAAPFLGPSPPPGGAMERTDAAGGEPSGAPSDSYVRVRMRMDKGALSVVDANEVAGPLVEPEPARQGLAWEVRVGDQRAVAGAAGDPAVARSFVDPRGEGPREHHIRQRDTFEFTVRVPADGLRGADPADVRVNLVDVREPPAEPLGRRALHEDPAIEATHVASISFAETRLPQSLAKLMGQPSEPE